MQTSSDIYNIYQSKNFKQKSRKIKFSINQKCYKAPKIQKDIFEHAGDIFFIKIQNSNIGYVNNNFFLLLKYLNLGKT